MDTNIYFFKLRAANWLVIEIPGAEFKNVGFTDEQLYLICLKALPKEL